ncbi:uncharacterized protein LOC115326851 [Ixodes scapularis]|uniref:uncharacterized protein LOC115326851 n=1 Tax=Ixodes scapularis TaxID=6945 RepID=UPI001C38812A|nr:uncharacterized protein LOC115326851 [Ixodes scapularis]
MDLNVIAAFSKCNVERRYHRSTRSNVLLQCASEPGTCARLQRTLAVDRRHMNPSHFPEHLVGTKAKPRLTRGSFPTLQLQGAPTASTGRKRLRSRAGSHNAPAISACGAFFSEGVDGLSSSHDHLHVEEATITVVKQEPEEMLDTPTIESLCSEDYSGVSTTPLHLRGEEDRACAVKEEVDSVSVASTCGDGYLEDAICLHFSAECPV